MPPRPAACLGFRPDRVERQLTGAARNLRSRPGTDSRRVGKQRSVSRHTTCLDAAQRSAKLLLAGGCSVSIHPDCLPPPRQASKDCVKQFEQVGARASQFAAARSRRRVQRFGSGGMLVARGVGVGDHLDVRPELEHSGQVAGRPRPEPHQVAKSGSGSPTSAGEAVAPSASQFLPVDLRAAPTVDLARPPEWRTVASLFLMNRWSRSRVLGLDAPEASF